MKTVLITGSKGQLGNEMQVASKEFSQFNYLFTDIEDLDICDKTALDSFIKTNSIDIIVNCAAYTAVDKAEADEELCYSYIPYTEDMEVCPTSVYGKSKLAGEEELLQLCSNTVIIRTSWLYSSFGNNFVKTMIKLGTERDKLTVIFDQVGTPTYAADLASAIFKIICSIKYIPGIYHFSNEGVCSWYDFTKTIHRLQGINCHVLPIETKDYPTRTPRPHYSVLNKHKIKTNYQFEISHWEESLQKCLSVLNQK